MKFEIINQPLSEAKADINVIFIIQKNLTHTWVKDKESLELLGFKGENEESLLIPNSRTLYVGCDSLETEDIRLAAAKALESLQKTTFTTLSIGTYLGECPKMSLMALIEGFILGSYTFDAYKSKKEPSKIEKIIVCLEDYGTHTLSMQTAQEALKIATAIAEATNFAKEIVNTIPNDMTPIALAEVAQTLSSLPNVTCKVMDEHFLQEQGMNAFLAVNRASVHPPRLIHLSYTPKEAKKRLVYVGKGLTYDSGGLSLKPSEHMVTMKADKSGGAAVMAIFKAAATLELPYEIHAIIGATENMIGGNAYKPDDVLVAKNGKTIEVRNTDAEGRLVLADCLCYAQELKPDLLVDMATLTGACVVALGEYTTGIMGHSSELKQTMQKAATKSGELTGTLPFNKYLKKLLKSSVADMSNISSSRYGGAITAGLFLDNFIEEENKEKWLHLDIAGPAYIEKSWGYNQAGASGAGVRMNLYWMLEENKH
ncbi:leucyl aminopeptidase [Sulfurospirillum deleyianum]|uniref:Probable cytosol aminopeptidase n=1 Tax=Sulfurospirillum deleyianum (strain ATCC 51133 / DSM 6946 / 5175) TaxID=525898 RepID=D1B198_SULD5|nr:leucyl aminopeptidase [Sulfurospirillum deleyianum]ACZ11868.1 Leucyl aminopeptidase [Sulfurospirillum deleyianum DSM 6946]